MTIYKLTLVQNRGWRFEPTEESFHVNEEVAEAFAQYKIKEGFIEKIYCGEYGTVDKQMSYHKEYHISAIHVNTVWF